MPDPNEPDEGQESAETAEEAVFMAESAEGEGATAPVSPDPQGPDAPGSPETAAPETGTQAADPVSPPPEPVVDRARGPSAQAQKAQADAARHDAAIAATPAPAPSDADLEEEKRKAAIRAELAEVQNDLEAALATIEACKERGRDLMAELYPSLAESDRPVDAVRGYVASQKRLRKNRALEPARLKAMLEAAGKAPIDAAFHRQRARGMMRPVRSQAGQAPAAAQDQAKDAVPDKTAAGQE